MHDGVDKNNSDIVDDSCGDTDKIENFWLYNERVSFKHQH